MNQRLYRILFLPVGVGLLLCLLLLYHWPYVFASALPAPEQDAVQSSNVISSTTTPLHTITTTITNITTNTITNTITVTNVAKPPLIGGRAPTGAPVLIKRPSAPERAASAVLAIDLWYGDTQRFGHIGNPQTWVNLLGTVSGPNPIVSLRAAVNGQPEESLVIGKDGLRLIETGDFNLEIPYNSLNSGTNQVVFTATDSLNNTVTKTATVLYTANQTWPLPYTADWATTTQIQDLAQVVDGRWIIENGMVRPTVLGYDRLINIGNITWQDYEVTVPMIVRGIDPAGYEGINNGPGVGLLVRWQGHFDINGERPRTGWQKLGALAWYRWYIDHTEGKQLVGYGGNWLGVNAQQLIEYNQLYMLKLRVESRLNQTAYYGFKMWKAANPEPAGWDIEGGGNVGEPTSGSLLLVTHYTDVSFGKVTIQPLNVVLHTLTTAVTGSGQIVVTPNQTNYAHGDQVTVQAIPANGYNFLSWGGDLSGNQNPTTVTMIKDTVVTAVFSPVSVPTYSLSITANGNGQVTVTPNQPNYEQNTEVTVTAVAAEGYKFSGWSGDLAGTQSPYKFQITKNTVATATFEKLPPSSLSVTTPAHGQVTVTPQKASYEYGEKVTITATPEAGYALSRWGGDVQGNANPLVLTITKNTTLAPEFTKQQSLFSEDFNTCALNSNYWSFIDPVGDAGYSLDGRQLTLTLPGGSDHDLWPGRDRAARLMQPTADVDLDLVVKFSTIPTQQYQIQGLLFSEDQDDWLRADFVVEGGQLYIFAATVDNGTAQIRIPQQPINPPGTELYLRMTRVADQWTQSYSFDGQQWTQSGSFVHSFVVRSAGIVVGNAAGTSSPATTVVADYFMNTAAPIAVEDAQGLALNVNVVGNGTVSHTPTRTEYQCNESISLTAIPADGWNFDGWSGKVTTTDNPVTLAFALGDSVTATFTSPIQYQVTVTTSGQGNVARTPEKQHYGPGEKVFLTAQPATGWIFTGWQGDVQSGDNPLEVTVANDLAVTATFTERPLLQFYLPLITKQ